MTDEASRKLYRQLKENRESLRIARIPIKAKRMFKELAVDEFSNDFGMCLKFLLDYFINDQKDLLIHARLDHIEARLEQIEEKPKRKQIKMIDGTVKEGGIQNERD